MGSERKPSKAPPASDEHRPVSGKKDTKRWCKGKVGREHVKEWRLNRRQILWPGRRGWYSLTCTACGREFDFCTDWTGKKGKCKCGHHGANKGAG